MKTYNRRQFVTMAGIGALGALASGCLPNETPEDIENRRNAKEFIEIYHAVSVEKLATDFSTYEVFFSNNPEVSIEAVGNVIASVPQYALKSLIMKTAAEGNDTVNKVKTAFSTMSGFHTNVFIDGQPNTFVVKESRPVKLVQKTNGIRESEDIARAANASGEFPSKIFSIYLPTNAADEKGLISDPLETTTPEGKTEIYIAPNQANSTLFRLAHELTHTYINGIVGKKGHEEFSQLDQEIIVDLTAKQMVNAGLIQGRIEVDTYSH